MNEVFCEYYDDSVALVFDDGYMEVESYDLGVKPAYENIACVGVFGRNNVISGYCPCDLPGIGNDFIIAVQDYLTRSKDYELEIAYTVGVSLGYESEVSHKCFGVKPIVNYNNLGYVSVAIGDNHMIIYVNNSKLDDTVKMIEETFNILKTHCGVGLDIYTECCYGGVKIDLEDSWSDQLNICTLDKINNL